MSSEGFENSLNKALLNKETIAQALDALEPGSPEAEELLGQWSRACHEGVNWEAGSDYIGGGKITNRATLKAEILIAKPLLSSGNYAGLAIESLWQSLDMAIQDDSTADLAAEIRELLGVKG